MEGVETMIAQDSAKFWFPKLLAPGPYSWLCSEVPNTVFLDYNEDALAESLIGQHTDEYERLYYAVEAAIRHEIAGPAFIRTDLTSAKHVGKHAYTVKNLDEDLNVALLETLNHAFKKSYHSKIKSSAIMVRALIDVRHEVTAFNGLPIGNEWRIFAHQVGYQCSHQYWPKDALEGHMDNGAKVPEWKGGWPQSWVRTDILDAASAAAKAMRAGKWSVDFVADKNDKYWLLDMATAGNSYHAPGCAYGGLDKQDRL